MRAADGGCGGPLRRRGAAAAARRAAAPAVARLIGRAAPPTGAPRAAAPAARLAPARPRPRAPARPRPLPPPRAAADDDGAGGGEVYEVAESGDDVWASIQLPVTMSSAEGQQVEYLVLDTDGALAEPAVESYMQRLQAERGAEAAAEAEAGRGGGGGDGWALDPTLLKRMAAVRDAERGLIVQELMYLLCIKRLKDEGLTIATDLGDATATGGAAAAARGGEPRLDSGKDSMGRRMEALMPLVSLPVADSVLGYVGATVTNGMRALTRDTPLSIDRVQAARLYAGMLEFGYFSRSLEAECVRQGVSVGADSEVMVRVADSLPEDDLKRMCQVQTADGWYTAVRHVGGLFGLRPNPGLSFDSAVLPYADLRATISDIVVESSEQIAEHYSPPGTADELARAAKRKQERGWNVDASEATPVLPEADLVAFSVGGFSSLLVEAAVLGCLLWDVERRVQNEFGYALESRSAREEHVGGS
ncbi:hypothetical protein Rsub_03249 [Raphidocelis subcapitata]|uniref:Uncharacterized protein n=1 Tax=Raphidocelis subcapitata TaxID=307507 RepID=A0A2V0NR39_9CHLO|nr:hypothetical protein Rsub_03249 [Raphidocelis subcapitata]|eukprot:GBF90116.1 hypothetical protein Rsub_03249 [Raphidocelis subcapitata]